MCPVVYITWNKKRRIWISVRTGRFKFFTNLTLIHGNVGTFCLGPALLLKKYGYSVNICSDTQRFDALVRKSDAAILFYYWRKGLHLGAHFVALQAAASGFIGYNTYTNSVSPDPYGKSLAQYLKNQGYFGCVLTAVRRK